MRPVVLLALLSAPAFAAAPTPNSSVVTDSFHGALQTSVPIDVPAFHGVEPALSLSYSSSGGSGFAGVGWNLSGFSSIERASPGQGAPRYDASDIFVLDGEELVACGGVTSPSCATGGTHATKRESYARVVYAGTTWTVTQKSGIKRVYTPVFATTRGTFRWGLASVEDTKGNRASYAWGCEGGDCYPAAVAFGPYRVFLHREPRPDVRTSATGEVLATTAFRLRSIRVEASGVPVRAYRLGYATSGTRRSQLVSVQQYGRDVVIDGSGAINGGTALPAMTFAYQPDPASGSFVLVPAPVTGVATREPVAWFKKRCAQADGSWLWKSHDDCPGVAWNAGGSSTRAIASGNGYADFSDGPHGPWHGENRFGLSSNDELASGDDIDFGFRLSEDPDTHARAAFIMEGRNEIAEIGEWSNSDVFRVAIENGQVVYYKNTQPVLPPRALPIVYPLRASAAMRDPWAGVRDVWIYGELVDIAGWCVAADGLRMQGDYNGDGKTDLLCKTGWTIQVRLGTGNGFAPATTWLTAALDRFGQGDFDGDGKTDVYGMYVSGGQFLVALSSGATFAVPADWTSNEICRLDAQFRITTGDFNRDGRTDVACQHTAGTTNEVIVGISTGTKFVHSRWLAACGLNQVAMAVDVDGDGRDDLACIDAQGGVGVNLSTGSSFDGASLTGAYIVGGQCDWDRWRPGDFNGDGKSDFACASTGRVFLSIGRAFAPQPASYAFCAGQLLPGDVDGDGLTDMICNNENAPANDIEVRLGTGTGFAAPTTWRASWCLGNVVATDLDGDRKTDLVCDETPQPYAYAGTAGAIPDLMTTWANGLGGSAVVAYQPSTRFPGTNNPPVVPVVAGITTNDGRGGLATTAFAYDGGLIDRQERRYLGFAHQRQLLPCAAAPCPIRDLYFAQDFGSLSKVKRVEQRDGNDRLLRSTVHDFTTNGSTIPYTSLETGTWEYYYGDPVTRRAYTSHEYDAFGNERRTVEHGDVDASGDERRVERQFYPNTTAFIVDRPGWESTMSGATGGTLLRQSIFLYDGTSIWGDPPQQGYLTGTLRWHDASNSFVLAQQAYDAWGNIISQSDETGLVTAFEYDATHLFRTRQVNPSNEATTTAFDLACATPTSSVDANGQATTYAYDALCRRTRVDKPLGDFEITSYLAFGTPSQRVRVETPLPERSRLARERYLDGFGREYRVSSTGPGPFQTIEELTTYGPSGAIASKSAPHYAGDFVPLTRYEVDALDRVIATTLADGTRTTTSYGVWSSTARDAHGHAVTTQSDAYGRIVSVAQFPASGLPLVTTRRYDALGNLIGVTDPAGNQWGWTFDSLGRNTQSDDPDAGTVVATFDAAGRMLSRTDARGQTTTLAYAAGRLQSRSSDDGTTTFTYSEPRDGFANVGRITTMADPGTVLQTNYDGAGRAVEQVRTLGGADYTIAYEYAPAGQLLSTTYPDGDVVGGRVYDRAGRLKAIAGFVTDVQYAADGSPVRQVAANGAVTTWYRSATRGWLERIATTGATTIQDLTFTRDATGMLMGVASSNATDNRGFLYDDFHRLTRAQLSPTQSETFAYDAAGNMTWNSLLGEYTYPKPGQPCPHAPLAIDGVERRYDDSGNLVHDGAQGYGWNTSGQATQIGELTFTYDGSGARVSKSGAGSTSWYPFGDDVEITDGVTTKYVAAPYGLVGKRVGTTPYWIHLDGTGSIHAITNAAGAEVKRFTYSAYGDLASESGAHVESRDYIAQRRDRATNLLYLHARYHSGRVGQFVSPDPSDPINPGVGTNRYAYGLGDSVNHADPSGLGLCVMERYSEDGGTTTYLEVCDDSGGAIVYDFGFHDSVVVTPDFSFGDVGRATLGGTVTGTVAGAVGGAIVGSLAPGPGTLAGAGWGALGGGIAGGIQGGLNNAGQQLGWWP